MASLKFKELLTRMRSRVQGESKVSKVTLSLKSFLKDFIKNKKTGEGENEEDSEMEELSKERADSSEDFVVGDDEPLEVVHQDQDEQDIIQVSKNERKNSREIFPNATNVITHLFA